MLNCSYPSQEDAPSGLIKTVYQFTGAPHPYVTISKHTKHVLDSRIQDFALKEFCDELWDDLGGDAMEELRTEDAAKKVFTETIFSANRDHAEWYPVSAGQTIRRCMVVGLNDRAQLELATDKARSVGIVSEKPSFQGATPLTESEEEKGLPVALSGQVPVMVVGPVNVGDNVVPSNWCLQSRTMAQRQHSQRMAMIASSALFSRSTPQILASPRVL